VSASEERVNDDVEKRVATFDRNVGEVADRDGDPLAARLRAPARDHRL
jgi:hypothetical protein